MPCSFWTRPIDGIPGRTIVTHRDPIVRWSWRTYVERRGEALAVARRPSGNPIVVRLAGQAEVDAWVRGPLEDLAQNLRS